MHNYKNTKKIIKVHDIYIYIYIFKFLEKLLLYVIVQRYFCCRCCMLHSIYQ